MAKSSPEEPGKLHIPFPKRGYDVRKELPAQRRAKREQKRAAAVRGECPSDAASTAPKPCPQVPRTYQAHG